MLVFMTKASEWAQRVAAWQASGLSAHDFCRGLEYTGKSLQWWSSRLRRRSVPVSSGDKRVPLARVIRSSMPPPRSAAFVVVELAGARVELGAGVDRAMLVAVFEALRASMDGAR